MAMLPAAFRRWSAPLREGARYYPAAASVSSSRLCRLALGIVFFAFALGCLTKLLSLFLTLSIAEWSNDVQSTLRGWGLRPSIYYGTVYPTSFTRDIHPIPIHSHNDYWRQVPLYSALAAGAISVEADVWEYDGELFVGHDAASLTRNRTFKSLYVEPLLEILDGMNGFTTNDAEDDDIAQVRKSLTPMNAGLRGVFDVDPAQTLHLYVDLKTPGMGTLPVVIQHLESLRNPRNYLTRWNGTDLIQGQITVHLSGDAPFEFMLRNKHRDYFIDAPLNDLASGKYNKTNALMATTPFSRDVGRVFWGSGGMTQEMRDTVKAHVKEAHNRGIGVRYWSTPGWPVSVRNDVWGELVRLGVDLLNVDDLKSAAEREW